MEEINIFGTGFELSPNLPNYCSDNYFRFQCTYDQSASHFRICAAMTFKNTLSTCCTEVGSLSTYRPLGSTFTRIQMVVDFLDSRHFMCFLIEESLTFYTSTNSKFRKNNVDMNVLAKPPQTSTARIEYLSWNFVT